MRYILLLGFLIIVFTWSATSQPEQRASGGTAALRPQVSEAMPTTSSSAGGSVPLPQVSEAMPTTSSSAGNYASRPDSDKQTLQFIEELKKTAGELEARLRLQPDNSAMHLQLGFIYAKLGDADKAQNAFENTVRVEPKNATAHYMLGLIYEKKGLKDKAVSSWELCLKYAIDKRMTETAQKHLNLLLKS